MKKALASQVTRMKMDKGRLQLEGPTKTYYIRYPLPGPSKILLEMVSIFPCNLVW